MKKVVAKVAKTYSIEKIADIYLAALAEHAVSDQNYVLPELLRRQNIYFDQEIIAGTIQLLEDRKYIIETGLAGRYTIVSFPGDKVDIIVESLLRDSDTDRVNPNNTAFFSIVNFYKITASGARFVMLGQVLDVQGRVEREAERKKRKERWVTTAIALAVSILTMVIKSLLFDN